MLPDDVITVYEDIDIKENPENRKKSNEARKKKKKIKNELYNQLKKHNDEESTDDEKVPKFKERETPSYGTKTQENSETETKSTSSNHQEDHSTSENYVKDGIKIVILIIIITLGLVVTEIILGILTSSLAILVYGFYGACKLLIFPQRKKEKENPHSITIVDAIALIVHAIYLVTFCLFISIEVLQRFMDEFVISYPMSLVIVGSIDVVFIIGLDIFNNYQDYKSILSIEYLKYLKKLLQDLLGALAVVASGINIHFGFEYYLYLDSVISLLIVLWILTRSVPKAWKILNVLLEHLKIKIKIQ